MAGFGFVKNALNFVSSKFADAGKTFQEAYDVFKGIIESKDRIKSLRMYAESKRFRQLEPFIGRIPAWQKIPHDFHLSTTRQLKEKYQYMFKASIRYAGQELREINIFSLLSPTDLSKQEATALMEEMILARRGREGSRVWEEFTLELAGIRSTRWIP